MRFYVNVRLEFDYCFSFDYSTFIYFYFFEYYKIGENIEPTTNKINTSAITTKQNSKEMFYTKQTTKKLSTKITIFNYTSIEMTKKIKPSKTSKLIKATTSVDNNIMIDESGVRLIDTTTAPVDISSKPKTTSKKCNFNPCQNDGSCVLIETHRFTCICKDFYYGVYCEHSNFFLSFFLLHNLLDYVPFFIH